MHTGALQSSIHKQNPQQQLLLQLPHSLQAHHCASNSRTTSSLLAGAVTTTTALTVYMTTRHHSTLMCNTHQASTAEYPKNRMLIMAAACAAVGS
jgi:hypothetical protein